MRPIPVAFHIWFLEVHTYGIGLALTFWFGLRYTERRLRQAGYPWQWVTGMFLWVVVAAIVGARALHVVSNYSYYSAHPGQVFAIWQGGLSSFGGLLFAVPVALVSARRRCPELPTLRFADLMAPVLMACWGIGRLLGPQLMVAGGGHPTKQWFGMYYAGQDGRRLPVPIFQAIEDFTIFGILLLVERWLRSQAPHGTQCRRRPGRRCPPAGIVIGVGMVLWGIERFLDEHLWLGEDGHLGSLLVQFAGIALAIAGLVLLASRIGPLRRWRSGQRWRRRGSPASTRPTRWSTRARARRNSTTWPRRPSPVVLCPVDRRRSSRGRLTGRRARPLAARPDRHDRVVRLPPRGRAPRSRPRPGHRPTTPTAWRRPGPGRRRPSSSGPRGRPGGLRGEPPVEIEQGRRR